MRLPIRVLLADDHPLIRAGIRTILTQEGSLTLVGEAENGSKAQRLCTELLPDVLLLDLNMPGPPASETVAHLREHCPHTKVLVLSAYDDDAYIRGSVAAGAVGYVLKDEAEEVVVGAIRSVMDGRVWFSQSVLEKLAHWKTEELAGVEEVALTGQDRRILALIARCRDNAQIAREMGLAEQTIRNRVSHIYRKLQVASRGEAIVWARERGLEKG